MAGASRNHAPARPQPPAGRAVHAGSSAEETAMAISSILLSDVPAATEMKLRRALAGVEFTPVPTGRASHEQLRALGGTAIIAIGDEAEAGFKLLRTLSRSGIRVIVIGPRKDAD